MARRNLLLAGLAVLAPALAPAAAVRYVSCRRMDIVEPPSACQLIVSPGCDSKARHGSATHGIMRLYPSSLCAERGRCCGGLEGAAAR